MGRSAAGGKTPAPTGAADSLWTFKTQAHAPWLTGSLHLPLREGRALIIGMIISEPGKPRPRRLIDWPKVTLLMRPEPGRKSQPPHRLTAQSPLLSLRFPICTVRDRDLSQSLTMPCRTARNLESGRPCWDPGSATLQPCDWEWVGNLSHPWALPLREARCSLWLE